MATDAADVRDETTGEDVDVAPELVETVYREQVLARTFDEKAVSLHRQGRIGTYAPMAGQEATQIGAATATNPSDWLFPTYRDHAMYLSRGFDLEDVLVHLRGRGNYVDGADPAELRTFPPTIPISTQLPHAVGVGMAADYDSDGSRCVHPEVRGAPGATEAERDEAPAVVGVEGDGGQTGVEATGDGAKAGEEAEDDGMNDGSDGGVVLASFGDGATSEGDFHEALNVAGVFDAPVVFLCQNNQYAISTPVDRQTASATIAQKAHAYGIDGVRIDGDDVLAVYRVVTDALERARQGSGPTLIEAVTYREGAHTTTDDPSVYRDETAMEDRDDPNQRTLEYLRSRADWSAEDEAAVREWADERVAEAVAVVESTPDPDPAELFENVFAQCPERIARQRERVSEESQIDR